MSAHAATNGVNGHAKKPVSGKRKLQDELMELNLSMKQPVLYNSYHGSTNKRVDYDQFHGDKLIGDARRPTGRKADWDNSVDDIKRILTLKNVPAIFKVAGGLVAGKGLDIKAGAGLIGSLSNDSNRRDAFIKSQVKAKYDRMLHPPLTYLGDAFQYRTVDGKFNSVLHPHLGQAGAPYAKTVPSKTHPLGALPDPGDLFDRLMAREEGGRQSQSGLSSMLIYHATIIIHDIFRTSETDKNISDSSSYLDLSPLYGYTMDMQRKIRDGDFKRGLLKPDTFAEDRLLRQPPGVCIMLVMYNRYHNYAAKQLLRINENGRFSIPKKFSGTRLVSTARNFTPSVAQDQDFQKACREYDEAWQDWYSWSKLKDGAKPKKWQEILEQREDALNHWKDNLEDYISKGYPDADQRKLFEASYDAAHDKQDDDLFNTARLITCGMYIQISIHDYLRALMGFHQFDTNFTLDPRLEIDHKNVSRGLGNQVTVEFNLLYRFHCAISMKDEKYTEDFMGLLFSDFFKAHPELEPDLKNMSLSTFLKAMGTVRAPKVEPCDVTFGLANSPTQNFQRNKVTNLFDDKQMTDALIAAMDDPISNFGPRNIPRCLKPVEIMGIMQARKWEIGTLNDFRDFFGMPRHDTFESITKNKEIQDALRDLYEHPDKVELYPGIFCESDETMGVDPGPSDVDSALWAAIFSDAITLVRSDRFYTVDWNTNSLTSWGMKEVTADNDNLKSSVFHRLIQRAFPGWFPYNSIRFFHPFYTSQQNAKYAAEQGYGPEFRMKKANRKISPKGLEYDVSGSNPTKPEKPVYLDDHDTIAWVLAEKFDFVHPAIKYLAKSLPTIKDILDPDKPKDTAAGAPQGNLRLVHEDPAAVMRYFKDLMQDIVKRESIAMNRTTFQIDATRDFAIPVVTRYFADFLGFGHLVQTVKNPKAPYSENQIYQHITNCQIFLSYNADETKLLRRRKAFRASFDFLYKLTKNGNVHEANRWLILQALFGRKRDNAMTDLGFEIAEHVLAHEQCVDKATVILLFVGLQTAYNSVLAFTSVLNKLIDDLYVWVAAANADESKEAPETCDWLKLQQLAFIDDKESDDAIAEIVLNTQRVSIKLPIIRSARRDRIFKRKLENKEDLIIKAGQTIICDIHSASTKQQPSEGYCSVNEINAANYLTYHSSITARFADYEPKHLAVMSLVAMIKMIALMRNTRRGHDAQGRLKKIKIDSTAEGYSNFMAPLREKGIAAEVDEMKKEGDPHNQADIYTEDVLKPASDTYLTPEWNEMVPFPMTWKIRFDGFGLSDYGTRYNLLVPEKLPDDFPPFYQPQGASHTGGTFADVACVCNTPGVKCLCKDGAVALASANGKDKEADTKPPLPADLAPAISRGCGIGA